MRLFIPLASLALLLSGCAFGPLEQLRLLDPDANNFSSALAAEYLAYANAESEQGRPLEAQYFAEKGMNAWTGKDVPPEPGSGELASSHAMLLALLTDDVKHVVPQQAARAQLLFDCRTRESGKTGPCAEELPLALMELQRVAVSFEPGSEAVHEIRFAAGSAKPGPAAMAEIKSIADWLRGVDAYSIELEGRADTANAKRLLNERVSAIKSAFAAHGVMGDRIRIKDEASPGAVYLSCDETGSDKHTVRATVRATGRPGNH